MSNYVENVKESDSDQGPSDGPSKRQKEEGVGDIFAAAATVPNLSGNIP